MATSGKQSVAEFWWTTGLKIDIQKKKHFSKADKCLHQGCGKNYLFEIGTINGILCLFPIFHRISIVMCCIEIFDLCIESQISKKIQVLG